MKNKKSPLKNKKLLLAVALFAAIGAAIVVYSRAATPIRFVKGTLSVGYIDAAPTVISKDSNNQISYESRSKEVSVSTEGFLYCVPSGAGDVTRRQLSEDEEAQLTAQVQKASSDTLTAGEIGAGSSEIEYRGFFIERADVKRDNRIYAPEQETPFVKETVALLDQLCQTPGDVIPDSLVPVWQNKPESLKISQNTIKNALVPKASAGGQSSTPVTVAEDQQAFRVNDARTKRGVRALKREHCLNQAARVWALQMALENRLYHSSTIAPYNTKPLPAHHCGDGWAKVGENVGYTGIAVTNDNQVMINASNSLFDAFWNSSSHQRNLMDPAFTKAGYGAFKTPDGTRLFVTQLFWLDRTGTPAPAK